MERFQFPIVVLASVSLLFSAPLFSQETRGSIEGIVTDQQGAAVPGATITATNLATGVVNKAQTGGTGNYTIPYLPPGTYRVSAEAQGFAVAVNPAVVLGQQETRRVDYTIQLGTLEQEIVVTSQAPLLQTGSTTLQGGLVSSVMLDLPLGRNAVQVATLLPGITSDHTAIGQAISGQAGGVAPAANGFRDTMASYSVDGANMTNGLYSYPSFIPVLDSVEEVTVQTANYSAEHGVTMGVHINFAMKSGTNFFHGTAWEFLENSALNARNFFSPSVPPGRANQFGGVFGGPIRKNKLFFFATYQGLRRLSYANLQLTLPNAAQRSGDLSVDVLGKPVPIFKDPTTRQPFPLVGGKPNQIPADRITPTAAAALKLLAPLPNSSPPFNWQGNVPLPTTQNDETIKIDNVFNDKDVLSVHLHFSRRLTAGLNSRNAPPFYEQQNSTNGYNVALIETHTFSPNAVLVSRASWNRMPNVATYPAIPPNSDTRALDTRALFGMTIPSSITATDKMNAYPQFTITGFAPMGELGNVPNYQFDENYEIASNLALVSGKHSLKMGVDVMRYRVGRFVNVTTNGQLVYSDVNPNGSGYALADFLLGLPNTANISDKPLTVDLRHTSTSLFIADKWRVSPKLTFDLGLRYEFLPPPNEHYGRMSIFSATPPGQFKLLGPGQPIYSTHNGNWAPRVGFTYQLTSKTLIRSAYGTFYSYPALLFLALKGNNPPFVSSYRFASAPGSPLIDSNPFPIGQAATGGVVAPSMWSPYQKTPRGFAWHFDLQHSFSPNVVLDVGYVGNRGSHLINQKLINTPSDPGLLCPISGPIPGCVPLGTLQSRRPLPNWGSIFLWDDFGFSTYHSLQVKLEKRLSYGLMAMGTYTWSKSMDIGSIEAPGNHTTFHPLAHNDFYGPSDMDEPHRLNFTALWKLPVGRGQHWAPSNRVADAIIGGWDVSATTTYRSGYPFSILYSRNINNMGVPQLPNRLCNGKLDNRTINMWYDVACFGSPIPENVQSTYSYGFQGNVGRGILRGPHFGEWNLGLMKSFTTFEKQRLQFRAEFYNAFNNVNFGLPTSTVGPGITNSGRISSAFPSRNITLALKYYF
ncbi:MAG: TonB-dependent receptor [Acidobacteriota bacterium]